MLQGCLDIWSGGQLLAFSGLDGPTDYAAGLCVRTAHAGIGLEVMLPGRCDVRLGGARPRPVLLAGDWFELVTDTGLVRGGFVDTHHLLVEGPCEAQSHDEAVRVRHEAGRTLIGAAAAFDAARIDGNLDALRAARLAWLERAPMPADLDSSARRTLAKAMSVLKTQVYRGEGCFGQRWLTADRWPHRDLWLWDSVFHAIGVRRIDPALAREAISSVLDSQQPDGFIPHQASPDGHSGITQPPVIGLGVVRVLEAEDDRDWLAAVYPKLAKYLAWDLAHRTAPSGLPAWRIGEDGHCRCAESGMDNSPRFDGGGMIEAVDFAAELACDAECLGRLADRLGHAGEAERWAGVHRRLCALIQQRLWHDELGLFVDYSVDREAPIALPSSAGLLPLICGAATEAQARRIAGHLDDPATFGTALPVASIPPGRPEYRKDMWRGPVWVNVNWLIAEGLDRYALHQAADRVRRATCRAIERYYAECGSLFEYYDTEMLAPPPALERKGQLIPGEHPYQAIYDYGWTATLYVDLLWRTSGAT